MVLRQVDPKRVAFLELEGDAPRPVDVNRVADRLASQGMKIESGDIHIFRTPGLIEGIEPTRAALL
jgi:hypothetical protein